ncbi:MAG: response regulator [Caldilineaceae bacterium]|nr:response regulator [Caldilineaceae bacterium]
MLAQKCAILIVDDDPGIRFLLRKFLSGEGYKFYEAENGRAGLKRYQCVQPDIILLDIAMPEMNGLDLVREIRKQDQTVGILLVSAFKSMQSEINLGHNGADGFLAKPFHIADLKTKLGHLLESVCARRVIKTNSTDNQVVGACQWSM